MSLLDDLRQLRQHLVDLERMQAATLATIAPPYRESARNLLHCIAFHQHNHPGLVTALRERGLSSLEGCEGHLAASPGAVISVLAHLEGAPAEDIHFRTPPAIGAVWSFAGATARRSLGRPPSWNHP